MAGVYFYQDADGSYILGSTVYNVRKSGNYVPEPEFKNGIWYLGITTSEHKPIIETIPVMGYCDKEGVAYATIEALMDAVKGFFAKDKDERPDIWDDTTTASVIYQGWKNGTGYRVLKTDLTAKTNTWALGAWADRTTLTYE